MVRCTRYNLVKKVCQWTAECYWFSLCTYICHFPWSGVLDTTLWKSVLVTCGMILVFSLYLYLSLPMVRCTRYNLVKKVCQWTAECYWFSLCTYIFHFPWSGVLDTTLWNKVCQWPVECHLFSLCTYICHFPWSGVLDKTLWSKVCQWPAECYWFSLCTYIFHFPWSGVLDTTSWKKYVSDLRNVTGFPCALIFFTSHGQVYSIQLRGKKVCQWPVECYWISLCTYIFHFPWSGVLDKPCETRCVSDLRKVVCFLFELIFFTSHGQV